MKACWAFKSESRPTFTSLVKQLSVYLESMASYVTLTDLGNECCGYVDQAANNGEQRHTLAMTAGSAVNETIM